eukprot:scaffold2162_cov206-Chaetoceros_neogracile.AAC.1
MLREIPNIQTYPGKLCISRITVQRVHDGCSAGMGDIDYIFIAAKESIVGKTRLRGNSLKTNVEHDEIRASKK